MADDSKEADTPTADPAKSSKPKGPNKTPSKKAKLSRRTMRDRRRTALREKLAKDKEFAKAFFAARSKRSDQKKQAYRKRHSKQTTA